MALQGGLLRCVVFGSGTVGKSSVVLRFITNTFGEEYLPTIEDRYRKVIDVNGTTVNLDILDTAGQEEFTSARDVWAREGKAFILVYSVTSGQSFRDLDDYRNHILLVNEGSEPPPIVLVGNKIDLSRERQVSTEEGKAKAEEYGGIPFIETSALDGTNCNTVFYEVVRLVAEQEEKQTTRKAAEVKPAKSSWRCNI